MPRGVRPGRLPPARRKRPPRAPVRKRTSRAPRKPPLRSADILAWADEHHARTGRWPTAYSGEVRAASWETWKLIDYALRHGWRGCPQGGSLPLLLHKHRGRPLPLPRPRPRLSVRQILGWADAFQRRTGRWPAQKSAGPVAAGSADTWHGVDIALRKGLRGLPGGSSLALLLMRYRHVRRARYRPRLTIAQILAWADAHRARTGEWPSFGSGKVVGARGETWAAIHGVLERGGRGLPAGYTLSDLLVKYRGWRNIRKLPPLKAAQILAWADAHHARTGRWPTLYSGPIPGEPCETWRKVESALAKGQRGWPGGSSLSLFLMKNRRRPFHDWRTHRCVRRERLTVEQILAWADDYHRGHGRWPIVAAGPIPGTRHESWHTVNYALRYGLRGLPKGSSLALLLEERRGATHFFHKARLTNRRILAWADAHHARTGRWPTSVSGPVLDAPGEKWSAIVTAFDHGSRGRPGGDTLARFLRRHGRIPVYRPFTVAQVLAWADRFHRRHGRWPISKSGPLDGVRGLTWSLVDNALRVGTRGLPGGSSLAQLLEQHRQVPNRRNAPRLTEQGILSWADAHHRRTGQWPTVGSGVIPESSGDTWRRLDNLLRSGSRGLPGGDTLLRLLVRHGRVAPDRLRSARRGGGAGGKPRAE